MMLLVVAAGFGVMFLAHVAPFPFLLDAVAPAPSLWHVAPTDGPPTVYLTFDDGPNPTATPDLLDVLGSEQAVATFFLIDQHVTTETAPIIRRMFAEGHGVGLHTGTRKLMLMTPDQFASHLTEAADRIEQLAGSRPCPVFRPHAGWRGGQMYAGLAKIDHTLVGWGWGLWDFNWYRAPAAEGLATRLGNRISAGDIIVMHDGHHDDPRADRRYTVEAAAQLIPALRARGFTFGTICDVAD